MSPTEQIATNQAVDAPCSPASEVHACEKCGEPLITAPALECERCGAIIRLHCFARRVSADCYVAECIDLDISAEGETLKEAIGGLQDAMQGYLNVVLDNRDPNTVGIVLRPSPLTHRIRYYFDYAKHRIRESLFNADHRPEKFYNVLVPSHSRC